MKKSELQSKTIKALKVLALQFGVKSPSTARKADLIVEILAAEKIKTRKRTTAKKPSFDSRPSSRSMVAKKRMAPKTKASPPSPPPSQHPPPTASQKPEAPPPAQSGISSEYDYLGEVPEAYGTGRLFFAARDPHWIYAYWDYTWQQIEEIRRAARHGELKLRVMEGNDSQAPLQQEITLNPSTRNWFIHVGKANSDYRAEFGYYDPEGRFVVTSRSKLTRTPPDQPSERTDARFVTIPFHISFRELFEMMKDHFKDGEGLADVLHRLQMEGFPFPFDYGRAVHWTTTPGPGLTQAFGKDWFQHIRMGSEEITQWWRRYLAGETSSGSAAAQQPEKQPH